MGPAIGLASRLGITRPSDSWRSTNWSTTKSASALVCPLRWRCGGIAKVVDAYALDKRTKLPRAVDLFEQSFGQLAAFHFRCALRGSLRDVTRSIVWPSAKPVGAEATAR